MTKDTLGPDDDESGTPRGMVFQGEPSRNRKGAAAACLVLQRLWFESIIRCVSSRGGVRAQVKTARGLRRRVAGMAGDAVIDTLVCALEQ